LTAAGFVASDLLVTIAEAALSGPYRDENLRAIRAGVTHTCVQPTENVLVAARGGSP
jgi:hypothetical protein